MTPAKIPPNATDEQVHWLANETMQAHFKIIKDRRLTDARTPEEFYGFSPTDVTAIYMRKQGYGRGVWYRLTDGRVIDGLGRPSETDRSLYITPTE